jgi:hypothetical protein
VRISLSFPIRSALYQTFTEQRLFFIMAMIAGDSPFFNCPSFNLSGIFLTTDTTPSTEEHSSLNFFDLFFDQKMLVSGPGLKACFSSRSKREFWLAARGFQIPHTGHILYAPAHGVTRFSSTPSARVPLHRAEVLPRGGIK